MKRIIFYIMIIMGGISPLWAQELQNESSLIKPVSTVPSAKGLSLEAPFRCRMENFDNKAIVTHLFVKENEFEIKRFDEMDALPKFQVNDFSVKSQPVDKAVQLLLDEAHIKVFTTDRVYPSISASHVYGELSQVMDGIAQAGEFFYKYDKVNQKMYLSRYAEFEILFPEDIVVMLAVLDAIRGAGIVDVSPNWNKFSLFLTLTQEQLKSVKDILKYIVLDSKLLLLDVNVFKLDPVGEEIDWQAIIKEVGIGKFYETKKGLLGKILTMGHSSKTLGFKNILEKKAQLNLISKGIAIVPNGWKARFDVGRCALKNENVNALSVLLSSNVKNSKGIDLDLTLDTFAGEATSFSINSALDEELAIVGIPATLAGFENGELFITFKLRLIELTKERKL